MVCTGRAWQWTVGYAGCSWNDSAGGIHQIGIINVPAWEIGNAGLLVVCGSTQCDRKRAIRQPLAAPFRPMAQHRCADTERLMNPWFVSGDQAVAFSPSFEF
ncbi:hypothetical protein Ancab_035929 [Ancistrocladus abbreviatus]